MVKPIDGFNKANIVRLWTHESLRVFGDRLVDDADRKWFLGHLSSMVSCCGFRDCIYGKTALKSIVWSSARLFVAMRAMTYMEVQAPVFDLLRA